MDGRRNRILRRNGSKTDRFLRACQRKPVDRTPVWFMRQSGRYLPEYQKIRQKHTVIEICKNPELSARVTLIPVHRFDVDAAIIFADIMLPLEPMGVRFRIEEGVGPLIEDPIREFEDIENLGPLAPPRDIPFIMQAIRLVKKKLDHKMALIGFSGAPFTLASYMIEGGPSREFLQTKALMYSQPELWYNLMRKLSRAVIEYLKAQVKAGVDAIQLFDSWVGCLSPSDYEENVLPFTKHVFNALKPVGVPLIHFSTGTAGHLELIRESGADVISVDWRVHIDEAWKMLGDGVGIQGNLDPAILLGDFEMVKARSLDIIRRVDGRLGHIFNLGHGVLPNTPVGNVERLVDLVHDATTKR